MGKCDIVISHSFKNTLFSNLLKTGVIVISLKLEGSLFHYPWPLFTRRIWSTLYTFGTYSYVPIVLNNNNIYCINDFPEYFRCSFVSPTYTLYRITQERIVIFQTLSLGSLTVFNDRQRPADAVSKWIVKVPVCIWYRQISEVLSIAMAYMVLKWCAIYPCIAKKE